MSECLAGARRSADQSALGFGAKDFQLALEFKRAYVPKAADYSVWGMLNAPATGEAMRELILDGWGPARRPRAIRARALAAA